MPIINLVYEAPDTINPYDLLTDVIAYYPMQGNLNDIGPNGWNIGTTSGSYTGTDYLTFTNFYGGNASGRYSTSASATLSAWCNGVYGSAIALGSDSYGGWGANLGWDGCAVVVSRVQYNAALSTTPTGWYMVTLVFDYTNHTLKVYRNGELDATTNVGNGGLRGGAWIGIGTVRYGSLGITFATQNAMTQADIQAFYNASKSLYQ